MDGKEQGIMETDIQYIRESVDDIKKNLSDHIKSHIDITKDMAEHDIKIRTNKENIKTLFSRYQKIIYTALSILLLALGYLLSQKL